MTNTHADGITPEQEPPLPPALAAPPVGGISESLVADVVAGVVTPGAVAAGIKYGLQSVNNLVTQRAETRREQIRQDGETTRAIIGTQTPSTSPPDSQQQ
ncbi:hypothetical protein ACWCPS_37290 [Streptomyces mauvecolor]